MFINPTVRVQRETVGAIFDYKNEFIFSPLKSII